MVLLVYTSHRSEHSHFWGKDHLLTFSLCCPHYIKTGWTTILQALPFSLTGIFLSHWSNLACQICASNHAWKINITTPLLSIHFSQAFMILALISSFISPFPWILALRYLKLWVWPSSFKCSHYWTYIPYLLFFLYLFWAHLSPTHLSIYQILF